MKLKKIILRPEDVLRVFIKYFPSTLPKDFKIKSINLNQNCDLDNDDKRLKMEFIIQSEEFEEIEEGKIPPIHEFHLCKNGKTGFK